MNSLIYGLRDPRTDEYKYIGKSNVGISRAKSHLIYSHNNSVNLWVSELRQESLSPVIDVLEYCEEEELSVKEKFWIRHYEDVAKCRLLNSIKYLGFEFEKFKADAEIEKNKLLEDIELLKSKIITDFSLLANSLKYKRQRLGVTQEDVAQIVGVSQRTIRKIEKGDIGTCSLDTILKYSEVLGYKIALISRV